MWFILGNIFEQEFVFYVQMKILIGDQPQAIEALVRGFKEGNQFQTLLGVTGSGKTFTMANVIQALNKPTLIISHNKTLAGQLYGEMNMQQFRNWQKKFW